MAQLTNAELQKKADSYFKANSEAKEVLITEDGSLFTMDNASFARSHAQKTGGEVKTMKPSKAEKPAKKKADK